MFRVVLRESVMCRVLCKCAFYPGMMLVAIIGVVRSCDRNMEFCSLSVIVSA